MPELRLSGPQMRLRDLMIDGTRLKLARHKIGFITFRFSRVNRGHRFATSTIHAMIAAGHLVEDDKARRSGSAVSSFIEYETTYRWED